MPLLPMSERSQVADARPAPVTLPGSHSTKALPYPSPPMDIHPQELGAAWGRTWEVVTTDRQGITWGLPHWVCL